MTGSTFLNFASSAPCYSYPNPSPATLYLWPCWLSHCHLTYWCPVPSSSTFYSQSFSLPSCVFPVFVNSTTNLLVRSSRSFANSFIVWLNVLFICPSKYIFHLSLPTGILALEALNKNFAYTKIPYCFHHFSLKIYSSFSHPFTYKAPTVLPQSAIIWLHADEFISLLRFSTSHRSVEFSATTHGWPICFVSSFLFLESSLSISHWNIHWLVAVHASWPLPTPWSKANFIIFPFTIHLSAKFICLIFSLKILSIFPVKHISGSHACLLT